MNSTGEAQVCSQKSLAKIKIIHIEPTEISTVSQPTTGRIEMWILRKILTSEVMGIFHLLMKNLAVARWVTEKWHY